MWLTSVSIRRPIFITMFVLALVVLGALGLWLLKRGIGLRS